MINDLYMKIYNVEMNKMLIYTFSIFSLKLKSHNEEFIVNLGPMLL